MPLATAHSELTQTSKPRMPIRPRIDHPPGPTVFDEYCPHFPEEWRSLLGRRPLLPGESIPDYDALVRGLVEQYRPIHFLAWIEIGNIARAAWNLVRLREVAVDIVRLAEIDELASHLARRAGKPSSTRAKPTSSEIETAASILSTTMRPDVVEASLLAVEQTPSLLVARAHLAALETLEVLDRLQASDEKRFADGRRALVELEHVMHHTHLFARFDVAEEP